MNSSEFHEKKTANVSEHPAVRGWTNLKPTQPLPDRIAVLQKRRLRPVYRMEGVGHHGADVVAKRALLPQALVEHFIYAEILPRLSIPTPPYYGLIEEENGEYGWLFLAYIEGEAYSPRLSEQRVLAARWLACLHTCTEGMDFQDRLPSREPTYYLQHLRSARDKIMRNLGNPVLTIADLALLKTLVAQCDIIQSEWNEIEHVCNQYPKTLVHADFASKNIRVQTVLEQILHPFDWGSSGWGTVAVDLAQEGMLPNDYWSSPDLAVYHSEVRRFWPQLTEEDLRSLAIAGKLFRCLYCMDLDADSLSTPWVDACMAHLHMYMNDMNEAIDAWRRKEK